MQVQCYNPQQAHAALMAQVWPMLKAMLTAGHHVILTLSEESKTRNQEKLCFSTVVCRKIAKPTSAINTGGPLTNQLFIRNNIMAKTDLTAARLRELLEYTPETGKFIRKTKASNMKSGSVFGCKAKNNYLRGRVDGTLYYLQRLAWLYVTGSWPVKHIDHIDGNVTNNALYNLREAFAYENLQNIKKKTKSISGIRNVYFDRQSGKWQVKIKAHNKSISYGYYANIEDAELVAKKAKQEIHSYNPEFTR